MIIGRNLFADIFMLKVLKGGEKVTKSSNKIRELRKKYRLTVDECCAAVGVSASAWRMYETGERSPRDDTKVAIAKLFNRTVQFIFFSE